MRSWLGAVVTIILSVAAHSGAAAAAVDCGPAPTVACLSAAVFSLAKTLPDDSEVRRIVDYAERELAPGDIRTALLLIVSENPDPSPWEDVEWLSQAGRFDRAIESARQESSPVARHGGLLVTASAMLDRNDHAGQAKQGSSLVERLGGLFAAGARMLDKDDLTTRAARIVEEVEPELRPADRDDVGEYEAMLPGFAAEIWARLGQTERAARLIGHANAVKTMLEIARKYPAAAGLRELAWREAERVNDPWAWHALVEDAMSRGDKAAVSRAAQRVSIRMDGEIGGERVHQTIALARRLLEAGFPDLSARLVKQWPRWVEEQAANTQAQAFIVETLIPVLVDLGWDQDVQSAVNAVSGFRNRSQCLSKGADEYFRVSRNDVARKFDAEALRVVTSSSAGDPKQQEDHESALHNLALARAGHGDVPGALDIVAQLREEKRVRDVTAYVARRAIDSGHGTAARPAIQAMEKQANAAQDAGLMLQAADDWYQTGEKQNARRTLTLALKTAKERQSTLDAAVAAELMWRLEGNGNAEAMLEIVDRLKVNDSGDMDRLAQIVTPLSPAVAVRLSGRVEVASQIDVLANIAIHIAEAEK